MDFADTFGNPLFEHKEPSPDGHSPIVLLLMLSAVGVMSGAVALIMSSFKSRRAGNLPPQSGKLAP